MRVVFLVSTTGSALALKLAKSGSEAMIAVVPKGETNWRCRHCRLDRRTARRSRPLEYPRLDLRAPFFAPVSAIAAIRLFWKDERPTPPVLFFLDAPDKSASPKFERGLPKKSANHRHERHGLSQTDQFSFLK